MMVATSIQVPRRARPGDDREIVDLLRRAALPTQDLESGAAVTLWVVADDDRLVGAIGLERYGADGLLRSLVVHPDFRNRGLGADLVDELERSARTMGIRRLVLLTQTAKPFFERRGYVVTARSSIRGPVAGSSEFRSLCPASATCLTKVLSQMEA